MMMANVSKIEKFSNFEAMKFERTRGKSASTRTRTTLHSEAGRRKRGPNPSLMLSTQEDTSSPVGVRCRYTRGNTRGCCCQYTYKYNPHTGII